MVNAEDLRIRSKAGILPGIIATFIGTVIGAGFASGREIYQFFSLYGLNGNLGLVLAVLIMGLAGERVFRLGLILRPRSYQELLVYLLGPHLAPLFDLILGIFFLILVGVMFAGSGAVFTELQLGYDTGLYLTAALLLIILFQELTGLILINLLVVPLMLLGALGICFFALQNRCAEILPGSSGCNWMFAALQFSAYNMVLAIPVLLSLSQRYPLRSFLKKGSWYGSIGLGMMAGFIHWAILFHLPHLKTSPLPMMELAGVAGKLVYWVYALILWGEMLTTLVANAYGVAQRLVAFSGWPFRFWVMIVTFTGILIAKIGFVNLIAVFYPLFGYLCLVILLLLFLKTAFLKSND